MRSGIKKNDKSVITDLAEAISSLDISEIANLLSDDGNYVVQDENYQVFRSDKVKFIDWLNGCYRRFLSADKASRRLRFTIVQNMHNPTVNPIILFEDGKFPVLSVNQLREEKSGLLIKCEDNKITGIDFCFLVMKTESPFIYEKRYLNPGL
jgi:hypothetical protein